MELRSGFRVGFGTDYSHFALWPDRVRIRDWHQFWHRERLQKESADMESLSPEGHFR
jgi:hypothetical protein